MAHQTLEAQLFDAAQSGDYFAVHGILNQRPELVHAHSPEGWTALHLAAHYGFTEIARLLIGYGADVNVRSKNSLANQPIHAAAAGRATDVIRLLLANGADANATQHGGFTPLHAAAQSGDIEMLQLLLDRGADSRIQSDDGKDAAAFATEQGHNEVLTLLREDQAS